MTTYSVPDVTETTVIVTKTVKVGGDAGDGQGGGTPSPTTGQIWPL